MAALLVQWATFSKMEWKTGSFQQQVLCSSWCQSQSQPQTRPFQKKEPDKKWTDNLPGSVDQPDIEIETITSASEKCDPDGAGVCNPYWADRFTYLQP